MYWEPSSDRASLYDQLAKKKFREIIRDQIRYVQGCNDFHSCAIIHRIENRLGSGQFGNVDKGIWNSPKGPVGVAVKTLKEGASEEEMVKFLQEAAIMGQFHHPNVVKLHGVVTVGNPVSMK